MDNLEDFLKGSEPAVEAVVETPEVAEAAPEPVEASEEPKGPARGPDGKFIPKGETVEPESASPAPETPTLEHPALLGERRRRQEAEDRARQLEEQLKAAQQPAPATQPQVPTDFWDDPESYIATKAAELAKEQARQIVHGEILSRSMNKVRGKYEDFNEAAQLFGQMIQQNPDLYDRMLAADEPAEFAYNQAKERMELDRYGSLSALIEARVQEQLAKAQPAPQPVPETPIPETLADQQSARATAVAAPSMKSLDDILGRRFV